MIKSRILAMVIIFSLIVLHVPVHLASASPDTVELWVDSYDARIEEWAVIGGTPYLNTQNQPTDYVNVSAKTKDIGDFSFADLAGSPSITSVNLYIYCDAGSEKINVYVHDGAAWSDAYTIQGSGWAWRSVDVSATLDTDGKIDSTKIYLESKAQGGWGGTVQADASYLLVDYTSAAPQPPEKPILVSPDNAIETSDNTPTFTWTGGLGAENHRIEVDDTADFSSVIDNENVLLADNSWTKGSPGYALGTYYWRVWAQNSDGDNMSENTWEFTVIAGPTGTPKIVVPRVFASVYAKGESGTIWTQVLDANGNPVDTATVTLTVWKPDGSKYLDSVSMGFVTGSNGIYNYGFTAPSEIGTYLCDVSASWNGSSAYGCGEFQIVQWVDDIQSILDNLIAHRSAVEATISAIEGYVDTLESGQTTITGYVDGLESGQTTITGYVDTVETVLGDPTTYGYTNVAHALNVIDDFVDQVEGYTDTLEAGHVTLEGYTDALEGGQTTLLGYTDSVESNQTTLLADTTLLKTGQTTIEGYTDTLESGQSTITGYVDQVEGYTDQVEGFVDEIEQYMGIAAMITDAETLYNYMNNTMVPYVDQVEGYVDQVEAYTDTLESGQTTIKGYTDTLEAGQITITDYVDTLEATQAEITAKLDWVADYLENTMKPQLDAIQDNVIYNKNYLANTIKPQLDNIMENLEATLASYIEENIISTYNYLVDTIGPAISDTYNQTVANYDFLETVVKPDLDNILENVGGGAIDLSQIYDNCNTIYAYLLDNLKLELDNVYENVNASYGYITGKIENLRRIEVTRHYQLTTGELQEFYVLVKDFTGHAINVDSVAISLEDPDGSVVEGTMSNPSAGTYYYEFETDGRTEGGWLTSIEASASPAVTYVGVWWLGAGAVTIAEPEIIGYLTLTVMDNQTNELIEGVKVEMYRAGKIVDSKITRWDGKTFIDLRAFGIHEIRWSKEGYGTETMEIDLAVSSDLTLKMAQTTTMELSYPPVPYAFGAIIIGIILLALTRRWRSDKGKKAGALTQLIALVLPVLLLIVWYAVV